jgi:hypothetical protein
VKDFHAEPRGRGGSREVQLAEDGFDLGAGYAGKPFEEVVDAGTVFEVREERLDRNSRAEENPGAAYGFGISLDGWAGAPIKHAKG